MLHSNGNDPAGNGVESDNHKAAGLVSMVPQTTVSSLTFEDREAARLAGVEQGLAECRRLDISDAVQAALQDRAREALGMARRYASVKGPAWTAMIVECGELE
jgi:hypothetical protein